MPFNLLQGFGLLRVIQFYLRKLDQGIDIGDGK